MDRIADMTVSRRGHSMTLMNDGRVLVAGGISCCGSSSEFFTASAEIFDPSTGTFTARGSLSTARAHHAATLLPDGRVLIVGGRQRQAGGLDEETPAAVHNSLGGRRSLCPVTRFILSTGASAERLR